MIRQYELVERVRAYDPQADENLLNRAYVFSMKAHGSQKRASGDPYFSHPLEVAGILTEMKLDSNTIVTALLHDTIEDTVATYEDIERLFGSKIAQLVDGVTKLSKLERPASESARQAENFRKLLVAMSNDIRVLLVKLADRLHNMRTIHFIKDPEKRKRIAVETMEIYAPLAERIGMQEMKEELEDLAFAQINGDAREGILARLEFLRSKGGTLIPKVSEQLYRTLVQAGVDCSVQGREKRPYSIWRKMEKKNISFEQLSDIMAFRIIVGDIGDCYRALGVIHAAYPMVPGRFKDYISTPKRNGYRSLHSTVIGPERQKIEVQIRTREMHQVAELGVAAHWHYKEAPAGPAGQAAPAPTDGMQYRWLRELLEILEHASTPEEFLEHTKLEMFQDQVFCFTPKGDLIALPKGATPLDFAYAVHTSVGHTCVGAKVNGRLQPLRTELQNGDQVEIVRSKAQTPSADWENLVVTGHARSAIRRFLRGQQREQYLTLGKEIIAKAFQQGGHEATEKAVEAVLRNFRQKTVEDLYVAVGQGLVTGRAVVEAVFPGEKLKEQGKVVPITRGKTSRGTAKGVPIKGLIPGMAIHYAGCCHPLPGDRIVGIVSTGRGVTVHAIDCKTLEQYNDQPERWLDLAWSGDESDGPHTGRITAIVSNEPGSLSTVANVIAKGLGNVVNLKFTDRTADFVEMMIDIEVRDLKHLTTIVAALRANPAISSVERARG
ncbi:RelA/SpoT family protein [Zavarzinia compransoris]|uniref:GTP pyrophosphokinase rsh n=1 Tax=Zavarzinia compransoris TaxID=1264899 RepID=A0A317EB36_9PROT|nr:bifunctional (p)ppGpp synthetase/guanosine-3',5'-bis(diphosphate) 3'-pyrophosphohydrolase [Zavarzinia compransoris]PWR23911.1 bifunctional (p)ppGpp synthetase/guanosine-3',5'-bis(diphosphate) 3'-pyrophosphohydrolase [Zavarzinia compransoris]TDP48155.1 GTP pyrophosphokinase [Zavarzinia compransoris]